MKKSRERESSDERIPSRRRVFLNVAISLLRSRSFSFFQMEKRALVSSSPSTYSFRNYLNSPNPAFLERSEASAVSLSLHLFFSLSSLNSLSARFWLLQASTTSSQYGGRYPVLEMHRPKKLVQMSPTLKGKRKGETSVNFDLPENSTKTRQTCSEEGIKEKYA